MELVSLIEGFLQQPLSIQGLLYITTTSAFTLLACGLTYRAKRRQLKQRWRIGASEKLLKRIPSLGGPAQKMAYLRKIDPFTFEECILTAFKRSGHRIKRNSRYTGDGGVDGQVWIRGRRHLIQAKRYTGHIRKLHVEELDDLCKAKRCRGLFVHTGRTGKTARASETKRVQIISGSQLIDLLEGRLSF